MNYVPSIILDQVIDALGDFMTPFMRGGTIVRGQINRVPLPQVPTAVLTELLQIDLSTPWEDYDAANQQSNITGPTRIDVQIDIYGELSSDICQALRSAFRTGYGFNTFPPNIKPLYMSDGFQSPLVSGENQYLNQWTLTAYLQYNPVTTVPQESAAQLAVNLLDDVDLN